MSDDNIASYVIGLLFYYTHKKTPLVGGDALS